MKTISHYRLRVAELPLLIAPLLVLLAIGSTQSALAQNPNLGTSGAQFLQIPVGSAPAAMGGACVASINDASALFWNPAGIVNVPSNNLFVSHSDWWATIKLNHAAYVHTADDIGSFGVSVTVLSMDAMEITTETAPEGTGQFFDAQDLMIGGSYARKLTDEFAVGVTVKYVNQRIWNETAGGVAFDIGTQYKVGFGDLTIAMSMSNFGADMKYDGRDLTVKYDPNVNNSYNRLTPSRLYAEEYPLPLHFQVGIAMTAIKSDEFSALLAVDVTHPNDNKERVNAGAELRLMDYVAVRGGYRFGYDTETATFGAGIVAPLGGTKLTFDYAYAVYDLLPNISRFSVGLLF